MRASQEGKSLFALKYCLCFTVFLIRLHTLMLTDSKRVYSCGCGVHGQLGHGKETPFVPLCVQLPKGIYISKIIEMNDKFGQVKSNLCIEEYIKIQ